MTYIPESIRRQVYVRARSKCEYCRVDDRYSLKRHEVDHIRAEKHGGATTLENLCLSCFECNHFKGTDLSSVDPLTDEVVPLYHPRRQGWSDHFQMRREGPIEGLTNTGRATVRMLKFNDPDRIMNRLTAMELNFYSENGNES